MNLGVDGFMRRKAVAAALSLPLLWAVAPSAWSETTVYGMLRLYVNWAEQTYKDPSQKNTASWDVTDESSRLGFKGSENLGNGQSAVWQYEFGVNAADGPTVGGTRNRLSYVGLQGGWGQFTIGTQTNPYFLAVGDGVRSAFQALNRGRAFNLVSSMDEFTNERDNNMLLYRTPSYKGLVGDAAVIMDGPDGASGVDEYQLALRYNQGPLALGAAYRYLDKESTSCGLSGGSGCDSASTWGASASYKFDSGLSLLGQYSTFDEGGQNDWWGTDLYVAYDFANGHRLAGGPWWAKNKDGIEQDYNGWILGWQYRFSKRSRLFAEYGDNDYDPSQGSPALKHENDFSIGMRHNF